MMNGVNGRIFRKILFSTLNVSERKKMGGVSDSHGH